MSHEDADDALSRWARRHDGLDPRASAWVSGWARLTDALARPLARAGVHPDAVTTAGVVVVAAALPLAALGDAWPLVAVLPVVLGAVLDGVDGALAELTGRGSPWGRVLDPLADRLSDLLLVALLVVLGAPPWPAVVLGAVTLLHESVRATAQTAGMCGAGAVTVWERPSRVIVASFATGLLGLTALVGVAVPWLPTAAVVLGLGLAGVGFAHLLVAVRRQLSAPGRPAPR